MAVHVKWLCLLLTALAVAVDGRLDVNVALNRHSQQASTYTDPNGIYYAMYANDGGMGTHYLHGPCAGTNSETHPWWAVDLAIALYVWGVKFTNRDEAASRADNFMVGLTDVSPTVTEPTLGNYAVCGQYPGAVPAGATVTLKCTFDMPPHRYLVVPFPSIDLATICELQVFIRRWEWLNHPRKKMINKVASTFQVDVRLQCMTNCTLSLICDSYNYHAALLS